MKSAAPGVGQPGRYYVRILEEKEEEQEECSVADGRQSALLVRSSWTSSETRKERGVGLRLHHHRTRREKMSKFRARALDATKPMPIFRNDELPDLPDFAAINRAVPQMPSGMEKEEECEHHLQRAMSAQQAYGQTGDLVIPTPEVYECTNSYEYLYPEDFKVPRQFIHMQPSAMEQDIPDYDMDSEDEKWVLQQAKKMDVTPLQFEEMMDRLEKGSGQQVVSWKEAKSLLKEDDDLITTVYDYWLNKRLRTQHALIPQVKTEKRDGSTNNNPYVAFRRRTEKMQTRKNRKNDEASYEKMLKLRRDLSRAVTLIEMLKRREKAKREHLHLNIEIFEKRYQAGDFSGQILAEVSTIKSSKPSYVSVHNNSSQYTMNRQPDWANRITKAEVPISRKKREYKKRKHKDNQQGTGPSSAIKYVDVDGSYGLSSEDEAVIGASPSEPEYENEPDGKFTFRRKKNCNYLAPIVDGVGNWPWCSAQEGGLADRKYRYCLTSLSVPRQRCIGFARRRIGRGGRFLIDRVYSPLNELLPDLEATCYAGLLNTPNGLHQSSNELLTEIKNDWLHFRPQSPPPLSTECSALTDCQDGGFSTTISPSEHRTTVMCTSEGVGLQQSTVAPGVGALVVDEDSVGSGHNEFSVESFQSHQEELLEMQRRQMEWLVRDDPAHTSQSSSSSRFTVDSASAQFAVSAVISTKKSVSGNPVVSPTHTSPQFVGTAANTLIGHSVALTNGPTTPPSCNNKFSSSAPHSSALSLVLSIPSGHPSSPCVSTPVSVLTSKSVPLKSGHDLKVSQVVTTENAIASDEASEKNDSKVKVDSLLKNENILPMEVT